MVAVKGCRASDYAPCYAVRIYSQGLHDLQRLQVRNEIYAEIAQRVKSGVWRACHFKTLASCCGATEMIEYRVDKNPHAQALGRLGGLARAAKLSKREQCAILLRARKAKAHRAALRKLFGHG